MRLNKAVAHKSKYSRREAEKLISEGRIKVDGIVITDPAKDVTEENKIEIDNRTLYKKEDDLYTVIVYNKEKGELVTKKDPMNRKTIYHSLGSKFKHFIPIGRLDFASEGLLLLTDSSDIATKLMESNVERVYNVKINGTVTKEILEAMQNGITISGETKGAHKNTKIDRMEFAPFASAMVIKNSIKYSKLKVSITEGQNRELRRFFGHFDREVLDLRRVSFGMITLSALPSGKSRFLTRSEYSGLRNFLKGK